MDISMVYPSQDLARPIGFDVVLLKPAGEGILAKIRYIVLERHVGEHTGKNQPGKYFLDIKRA